MKLMFLALMTVAMLTPVASIAGSSTGYAGNKASPADGGGCISGSIGSLLPGNNVNASVFFGPVGSNGKAFFAYTRGNGDKDFLPRLSAFTMCLEPGSYRITGFSTGITKSKNEVNIPFEVTAGRNTYLGTFIVHAYRSHECAYNYRFYVEVRDEFDRDSPAILAGRIAKGLPLDSAVVDPTRGSPYFVTCNQSRA